MNVSFRWASHEPGALEVNLPADLPPRFGGRFNEACFGQGDAAPEVFEGVFTEPVDDPGSIVRVINEEPPQEGGGTIGPGSQLIRARHVTQVPAGVTVAELPILQPRFLSIESGGPVARLYLTEVGVEGAIELRANEAGDWGQGISIMAVRAGPGTYNLSVFFPGDRFENARRIVAGQPIPALTQPLAEPGPVGVLQSKAAGVGNIVPRF